MSRESLYSELGIDDGWRWEEGADMCGDDARRCHFSLIGIPVILRPVYR